MKKKMRLLVTALAAVMATSVYAPVMAAENNVQQVQAVSTEETGIQETDIVLPSNENSNVEAVEPEITEYPVSEEISSEYAGKQENPAPAEEETPAEPEEDKEDNEDAEEQEKEASSVQEDEDESPAVVQPEENPDMEHEDASEEDKKEETTDGEAAVPADEIKDGDDVSVTEAVSTAEAEETHSLAEPVMSGSADAGVKNEAVSDAGTVTETAALFKIAAPDASTTGEGRWEEIIETIHHDEQGHYEKVQTGTRTVVDKDAWDEPVYEMLAVCDACGYTSDSTEDINNHLYDHYDPELGYIDAGYSVKEVLVETIHHPAGTHEEPVYEDKWIVDSKAWDETVHTGQMRYVVDGKAVTDSLVVIDGETYYLDKTGSCATGWTVVNGSWRLFDESGKMQTGWQEKNGARCYVDESTGKLVSDKVMTVDGTNYYFDGKGAAHEKGAFTSGGKEYYFDGTNLLNNGWNTIGEKKYYFGPDGVKKTGILVVNGTVYPVGEDGALKPSSWVTVSGKTYYTNAEGAAVKGWQTIAGKKYFMDGNGVTQTGPGRNTSWTATASRRQDGSSRETDGSIWTETERCIPDGSPITAGNITWKRAGKCTLAGSGKTGNGTSSTATAAPTPDGSQVGATGTL